MFELDHIAVAGETLGAAVAHSEAAFGRPLGPGGQHAHYATHNRLLGLADDLYFEAIATDPTQLKPAYPRWFGLDTFQGAARLDKWILRCNDIQAVQEAFPDIGSPVHLTRGDLSWTMIVPDNGLLPYDGLFPAFIQWHADIPPGKALPSTDLKLTKLEITHPKASEIASHLEGMLDDSRVQFRAGTTPGLIAEFETPDGPKILA